MSRFQQDTFIDEEEEVCPLCVEEFDIQDRNFRPCPCGYQICQFCFNNIRQNLNGLCPACRRPYDDESIVYKVITAEEAKAEESKKKRAAHERKKHEAQKREIEQLNRKHLSGLRVIQRNLVYVTGLNPRIREDELLQTLRGDQYFGQYGRIVKIVVNKRTAQGGPATHSNHNDNSQGLGVYVTFSIKNEAEKCIAAVDGSVNGDRVLRATYGTTKYCSAYLRNDTCPNKNCMFLHESGEEAESFSRMELSTANSRQTKEQAQAQLPPQPRPPVAAATPSNESHPPPTHQQALQIARQTSHVNDAESSALPSTANWAKNPPTPATRPASLVHQASSTQPSKVSTPSPKAPASPMAQPQVQEQTKAAATRAKPSASGGLAATKTNGKSVGVIGQPAPVSTPAPPPQPPKPAEPEPPKYILEQLERYEKIQKAMTNPNFKFILSRKAFSDDEYDALCKIPPMFDNQGGKRRREMLEKSKNQQPNAEGQHEELRTDSAAITQAPIGTIGNGTAVPPRMGLPNPALAPLQQQRENAILKEGLGQHQSLQSLSAHQQHEGLQQHAGLRSQTPQGLLQQAQAFGSFQGVPSAMGVPQQPQHPPGHTRQSSRYAFANDNSLGSATTVNARSNPSHMAEQIRMMPTQQQQQQLQHHQQLAQMYASSPALGGGLLGSVQQPPPGLKSAPTPPAPGLGGIPMGAVQNMGQFAGTGFSHHGKSGSDNALLRELLAGGNAARLANATGNLMGAADGKRNIPLPAGITPGYTDRRGVVDLGDPSILQARVAQPQHPMHQQGIPAGGHAQPGGELSFSIFQLPPSRLMTPGIVDEDFPALAPPKPSTTKTAIGTPVNLKKPKEKVAADSKGKGKAIHEAEPSNDAEGTETATPTKQKPKLAPVDTATAATETDSRESPAVQTPNDKKGALRMMRILSKDSTISAGSSSVKTKSSTPVPESVATMSDTMSIGTSSSRPVTPPPMAPLTKKERERLEKMERKEKEKDIVTGPALADLPPVPVKSKSALKKERIAAMKEKERMEAEAAAAAKLAAGEKDEHAPVVGRLKKKEKKKAAKAAAAAAKQAEKQPSDSAPIAEANAATNPDESHEYATGSGAADEEGGLPEEATPAASQIIAELQAQSFFQSLEMFKPLKSADAAHHLSQEDLQRLRSSLNAANPGSKSTVDLSKSPKGSVTLSLRGGGTFETCMLVTPHGSVLRGLTPEQEKRYLDMEERRRNEPGWARWGHHPQSSAALTATTNEDGTPTGWKAAVTAHTMAAGLAAAGSVARHMHLGPEEANRLSTKEALDYLWNMVMPSLPGYAQEHLEGLAQSMAMGGCRVSVGFEECEPQVTVDVKVEAGAGGMKELEKMVMAARKETEGLEKKVEKLIKRNRKIAGLT